MLRDHDNIIKNLRNELNQLRDRTDTIDKGHTALSKNYDAYKTHNDQTIKDSKIFVS